MTNELNRRALMLCEVALACPPEDLAALLDEQCASDPALREAVDAMLALQPAADGFLVQRKRSMPVSQHVDTVNPGDRIGPFEITGSLGGGGMGDVYAAEQEHPVRRRVALKIIKLGMDTKQVIARFEAERQALALMDHPNIAKVLDAGATDKGRPYFVMELVEGIAITEYCDKQGMSLRDRLNLFVQVCTAVQHAHQKGIIHRDIKPSNVLVTHVDDKPAIKVIDFGIAKATEQRLTEQTLFTEMGQLIGTPAYMSPEQADPIGLDIDTRSDIFSMGVLLYELLTGMPPFDVKTLRGAAMEEIKRIIREDEPRKPSTRLSQLGEALDTVARQRSSKPQKLESLLRGDLDWIIMKALEKDRTRRYATASGFAQDIDRYLKDEPVDAGPPSGIYRLRKFARRNRAGVIACSLVVAALVFGVIGTTWGMLWAVEEKKRADAAAMAEAIAKSDALQRADEQTLAREAALRASTAAAVSAEKAQQEAATAKAVIKFLQSTLTSADPSKQKNRDYTVREAVVTAAERVADSFPDQPDVEAVVRNTIGSIFVNLAMLEQAEPQLQTALEIRRRLHDGDHLEVAESLCMLGALQHNKGNFEDAKRSFGDALAMQRRMLGEEHKLVAESLRQLGTCLKELHDLSAAEPALVQALAIDRRIDGGKHEGLIGSLNELAYVRMLRDDVSSTLELLREALALTRELYGEDHLHFARQAANMGQVLFQTGKLSEAEPLLRQAIKIRLAWLDEDHPLVSAARIGLARLLLAQGDYAGAAEVHRQILKRDRKRLPAGHPYIAGDLINLAEALDNLGQHSEAESMYREALEALRAQGYDEHPRTLTAMAGLGQALLSQEKLIEAEVMLRKTLDLRRRVLGERHRATFDVMSDLASLLHKKGEWPGAEKLFREALNAQREDLGDSDSATLATANNLALLLADKGELDEAEPLTLDTLERRRRLLGDEHPHTLTSMNNIAVLYDKLGRFEEAEPLYVQTLELRRRVLGEQHPHTHRSMYILAGFYRRHEQLEQAETLYVQTLKLHRSLLGERHPDTLATMNKLAMLYADTNRPEEAESLFKEAADGARSSLPTGDRRVGLYLLDYGRFLAKHHRFHDAEVALLESHTHLKEGLGARHEQTIKAIRSIVDLYEAWEGPEKAAEWRATLGDAQETEAGQP